MKFTMEIWDPATALWGSVQGVFEVDETLPQNVSLLKAALESVGQVRLVRYEEGSHPGYRLWCSPPELCYRTDVPSTPPSLFANCRDRSDKLREGAVELIAPEQRCSSFTRSNMVSTRERGEVNE